MSLARLLIVLGILFIAAGLLVSVGLGRLPGDIVWRRRNSTFYFPLATCLLLSIVLSLIFWLIGKR